MFLSKYFPFIVSVICVLSALKFPPSSPYLERRLVTNESSVFISNEKTGLNISEKPATSEESTLPNIVGIDDSAAQLAFILQKVMRLQDAVLIFYVDGKIDDKMYETSFSTLSASAWKVLRFLKSKKIPDSRDKAYVLSEFESLIASMDEMSREYETLKGFKRDT